MKLLTPIVIFLSFILATNVTAQDEQNTTESDPNITMTATMQEQAADAFATGKNYFAWIGKPGLFRSNIVFFIYCIGNPDTNNPPFSIIIKQNQHGEAPATLPGGWELPNGASGATMIKTVASRISSDKEVWQAGSDSPKKIAIMTSSSGFNIKEYGPLSVYLANISDKDAKKAQPISNTLSIENVLGMD